MGSLEGAHQQAHDFRQATIPVRPSIAIERFIEFLQSSAAGVAARD
jgi:hypothetical protein